VGHDVVVVGFVSVQSASVAAESSLAVHAWVFNGVDAALPHSVGQVAMVSTQE
jgi:hypothetical protein